MISLDYCEKLHDMLSLNHDPLVEMKFELSHTEAQLITTSGMKTGLIVLSFVVGRGF